MSMMKMYLVSILFLFPLVIDGTPVPTILETDIGSAYDDQLALTYMLSRQDLFDLKLIICSTSNTTARAQIVAKTLSIFKRFDVPIAIGRYMNDSNVIYEYRWSEDYSLEKFQTDGGIVFLDGEQALLDEMKKASPNNIYHYVQLSPPVSLGNVLKNQSSLSTYIRLFAMAGSLYRGYDNSDTPSQEYNVGYNIEASQTMFSSNWTYFGLAPLDCTNFMQFNGPLWERFLSNANTSPIINMIIESYTIWYDDGGMNMSSTLPYTLQTGTPEMHDILAVYLAGMYTTVSPTIPILSPLFVTNDGYTRQNQTVGRGIHVCTKYETPNPYVSTARIGSIILESIARTVDQDVINNGTRFCVCLQLLIVVLFYIYDSK